MPRHHKDVACPSCRKVYVPRVGARGCACSRSIIELPDGSCWALDAYAACDLSTLVAVAAPNPLALHAHWLDDTTRPLVDTGVVTVVREGDRVVYLRDSDGGPSNYGPRGTVMDNMLVKWDWTVRGYPPSDVCAGNGWDVSVVR